MSQIKINLIADPEVSASSYLAGKGEDIPILKIGDVELAFYEFMLSQSEAVDLLHAVADAASTLADQVAQLPWPTAVA